MPSGPIEQQGDAGELACKDCGSRRLRRLPREGFLQKSVYAFFGYFPWECPMCRTTQFFKKRGKRTQRNDEWSEEDMKTY